MLYNQSYIMDVERRIEMINFYFSDKDYEDNRELIELFNWEVNDSWFDELANKIVEDVDQVEVIAPGVFKSDTWGTFSREGLSGGIKVLLCLRHKDNFVKKGFAEPFTIVSGLFGDNCSKWIVEISKEIDVNIKMRHILEFPEELEFDGYSPEFEVKINNMRELREVYFSEECQELRVNKYGTFENPIYTE